MSTLPPTPQPVLGILCQWLVTLAYPFVVVLLFVRLVMTPIYLQIEYTRPGFPADPFGFTTEDRLRYAPLALEYLLNGADISFLGNLRFENGLEMYNVRELQHMRDVKAVTQIMFTAASVIGLMVLASLAWLWRTSPTRVRQGLLNGSLLTLSLIAVIVILAITSWDVFFTGFHDLFFADGTWQFAYSDTLIRLFPEQFWFDAALVIGGLTSLTAVTTLFMALRLKTP